LAEKGKPAFCHKPNSTPEIIPDHASDARVLGYVAAEDELCGTHVYKAVIGGMKKRGELYPGMLNDYAEEYVDGKRTQFRAFKREGETKTCRDDRRIEREDADFERITRALGVYEIPSFNAGYESLRIDRKEHDKKMDDQIIAEIRRSAFVVADLTEHRGGVYYEAGFAHGLGRNVIFTCQREHMDKLHFDVRQYNTIGWERAQDIVVPLQNRILALFGAGPIKPDARPIPP